MCENDQTNRHARTLGVMAIHVSLVGRKDLKGEVYRQLRAAIRTGQLRPGEYLTPSRELAQALAVSRSTVVAAYDRLAAEGFVTSRPGAGTFVSEGLAHAKRGARTRSDGALRPLPVWDSIDLPTVFDRAARFDFRTARRFIVSSSGVAPVGGTGVAGGGTGRADLPAPRRPTVSAVGYRPSYWHLARH